MNFLKLERYTPPEWASRLSPIPRQRVRMALTPTPIHPWKVPGVPPGVEMHIKRDDLSGMQLSGNKVRKLEFLMADALGRGCDCVVTIGGIQSNHCRATAVAATYVGLESHLILRTSRANVDQDPGLGGNLLVDRLVGANLHLVTKEEYVRVGSAALCRQLAAQLAAEGRRPYVIPVGGSNALGTWGYLEAVEEIVVQCRQAAAPPFTDIVMACGSGGTSAGLALGSWLSGLRARVLAFGVCDTPDYFYDHVDQLCAELGAGPADVGTNARGLLQVVNAKGSGYAISREDELRCIAETAAATGVVLDPVYSGKALHGLLEEMRRDASAWAGRRVLFVHTGGLLGLYDKAEQLQPLLAQVAAAAAATTAAAEATATATAAATASLTAAAAAAPADTGAATAGSEDATSAAAGSSSSGNYASGGSSAAVARRRRRCCVVERMQVE